MRNHISELLMIFIVIIAIRFEVMAGGADTLSLQRCMEKAETYSFRIEEFKQKSNAAQSAVEQQKIFALPEFSIDGGVNSQFLSPYNFQQSWLLMRVDWSLGDLFMKTSVMNENQVLALKAKKEQVRLQLMQRVAMLYMGILQKDVQLHLYKERLQLLNGHLLMARALWQAGTQSEIDVLQTQSEITRLEEVMITIEVARDNLKLELGKLMGVSESDSFGITPVNLEALESQQVPYWEDSMIARHPLIRTIDYQILAENEKSRFIKAQQIPTFSMRTGYVSDADPTSDGNYWQITGGINIPVFRWNRTSYQKQQLIADVVSLNMQRAEIRRELNIQIGKVLERLDKYRELYQKQLQRLDYADQAYKLADIHYQAGLITNLSYLNLQEQYSETKIALQDTMLKYSLNLVEFFVITGQMEDIDILFN